MDQEKICSYGRTAPLRRNLRVVHLYSKPRSSGAVSLVAVEKKFLLLSSAVARHQKAVFVRNHQSLRWKVSFPTKPHARKTLGLKAMRKSGKNDVSCLSKKRERCNLQWVSSWWKKVLCCKKCGEFFLWFVISRSILLTCS